jgi:hypothetical protein
MDVVSPQANVEKQVMSSMRSEPGQSHWICRFGITAQPNSNQALDYLCGVVSPVGPFNLSQIPMLEKKHSGN